MLRGLKIPRRPMEAPVTITARQEGKRKYRHDLCPAGMLTMAIGSLQREGYTVLSVEYGEFDTAGECCAYSVWAFKTVRD